MCYWSGCSGLWLEADGSSESTVLDPLMLHPQSHRITWQKSRKQSHNIHYLNIIFVSTDYVVCLFVLDRRTLSVGWDSGQLLSGTWQVPRITWVSEIRAGCLIWCVLLVGAVLHTQAMAKILKTVIETTFWCKSTTQAAEDTHFNTYTERSPDSDLTGVFRTRWYM